MGVLKSDSGSEDRQNTNFLLRHVVNDTPTRAGASGRGRPMANQEPGVSLASLQVTTTAPFNVQVAYVHPRYRRIWRLESGGER
jgi:hypothetical protein